MADGTSPTANAIQFHACAAEYAQLAELILARVAQVLGSGKVLQGPEVEQFEHRLAQLCGRKYAVAVGSGTDAVYFALRVLGIGPGDEVLVPDVSFLASATAIARTGATPVFVDIDTSCHMDLSAARSKITSRTCGMVFVQLFGGMACPAAVEAFAADHGLALVEDFAQSLGARYRGRPAGSSGHVSAVSFDPTKVIGAPGSGGAVVTDDAALSARVRRLRLHGKEGSGFAELGYNSQLATLTAAVLDLKLDWHDLWTARRRAIATRYVEALADCRADLPHIDPHVAPVWHKFTFWNDRRDDLRETLSRAGVPTMIHYPRPLHAEPIFGGLQSDEEFPRALSHCRRTLSLPIHAHLTDMRVAHVTATLRQYLATA